MAQALQVVDADDDRQRALAQAVRREVFVREQGVSEALELDEHDATCQHVLALIGRSPVGAARYRETEGGHKLERVAVLAARRGAGVGEALVDHIHRSLPQGARAYVHAQASAIGFWERMGYAGEGEAFFEAGIEHRKMVRVGG
jgi:predicted GNAT family N-acyltransferase